MLVLSRKVGERVLIADGILVQVLETHGQRIRLGIEAPGRIGIRREELGRSLDVSVACPGPVCKPR
jgi:carbon storage regulator